MSKLFKKAVIGKRETIETEERWFSAVPGIVADNEDPERQHRIRVIIPSIDESLIFDEWVRPLAFCMGNGYGAVFIPPLDTEVVLFGTFGEKYNLFYVPTYSEEMIIPPDFEDETVSGFRVPGDFKQIVELDMQLRAGRIDIEADEIIKITAPGGFWVNGRRLA